MNFMVSKPTGFMIGFGGEQNTGDKDSLDRKLHTYNVLFGRPLFEFAAPLGSANIESIHSFAQVSALKKAMLKGSVYLIRRQSIQDGVYAPDGAQIRPDKKTLSLSQSRFVGTQYTVEAHYLLNRNLDFATDAIWFKAGSFLKETGRGENIAYLSFKATYKF